VTDLNSPKARQCDRIDYSGSYKSGHPSKAELDGGYFRLGSLLTE